VTGSSELRALTLADAKAGFALSAEAGWNQTEDDWRFLLRAGEGVGIDAGGRLVATTIVLKLPPRIAWIGMVLVTPAARKRGLATAMLGWSLDWARQRGLVAALDATPDGREVYRRLGFADGAPIMRMRGPAAGAAVPGGIERARLDEILPLDETVFGADRGAVLRELAERAPARALMLRRGATVAGYVFGRDGRTAPEIGPLVAADEAAALALLDAAHAGLAGPALADVFAAQDGFVAGLAARGWREERPYTRMAKGSLPACREGMIYTVAGPELG
jgi:GNAT superfamily N-acetyltransferase